MFFSTFGEWVGGSEANVEFSTFFFDGFPYCVFSDTMGMYN